MALGRFSFLSGILSGTNFPTVGFRQRQLLYTGDILDGQFGCHSTIRNDMRHLLLTILFRYPAQYFTASVIIEVHINIRQGMQSGQGTLNSRSYWIGSILVMPKQYATAEPAAEPRPGPTETPNCVRAALIKSCTIRK